jgi:hypothetical protein
MDSEGKVYIYFSQEQIAGLMGCGVKKVRCLLKELDDRKGIGLITRVRQGLGNPDRIYVKKCVSPERFKENFRTGQNDFSGKVQMTDADRCKLPGNDIEDSNTENNDTEYLSFYSDASEVKRKEAERNAYQQIILEHIGYDCGVNGRCGVFGTGVYTDWRGQKTFIRSKKPVFKTGCRAYSVRIALHERKYQ